MERFGGDVRELWDRVRWMGNEYGGMDSPPHRIVIVGLPGTGKKTLFNTLWGREAVTVQPLPPGGADFGLFRLVDLPCEPDTSAFVDYEYMAYAPVPTDDASLVVYLINSVHGLSAHDFQWISRLRVGRAPLLVILNWVGEANDEARQVIETHLARRILPLHANDPAEVRGLFVEALMQAAPELGIPLAAQIGELRQVAAQRIVKQAAVLSMAVSVEPLPLIDLSVLIGVQLHMLYRLGGLYGRQLGRQGSWELVLTVAFGLVLRYGAQTLLKMIPWGGWIVSGVIGASATWAVGQTAILYYEDRLDALPAARHRIGSAGERRLARLSRHK